jgi:hypothetical protein
MSTENDVEEPTIVSFLYTNWKRRTEIRRAQPLFVAFGNSGPFHNDEYAWYLSAICCDRGEERVFLLKDMANLQVEQCSAAMEKLIRVLAERILCETC